MTLLTTVFPVFVAVAIVMPARDAHLQFEKWGREYGPVYSLILGTKTLIVLSSDKAVKDLLDKKSNMYSHRQEMYIGQTLCSGDLRVLMMGYDARWRMCRKLVHTLLNISAAKSYVPYQMLENKQMLYDMITQPERCMYNIRRYTNSLTTTMVFGWRSSAYEDEKMMQLFEGFSEFAELNQTGLAALVDFFPWFPYLPDFLLPVRAKAKELHRKEKGLYLGHWLKAKEETKAGTIMRCFSEDLVGAQKTEGFSDDQASYITGTLLEAGSDTTSSTLYAFVQAMVLYPDVQKKAQAEIDRVVGPNRMPTMDDEHNLQYIRGIVKESLRWMPTTIMGAVPHAATQDDWYDGHLIPAGAGVVNNVWAINTDPARHPDPRRFDPARLPRTTARAWPTPPPPTRTRAGATNFTFGAGRRICPGIPRRRTQPGGLTQEFVCQSVGFAVAITPRSEARRRIVVEEWLAAERDRLDPFTKQWRVSPLAGGGARKG
ncbi:cytochrome P450 [Chaetomium fimeti]|uniref:Cytochrome P450 n=1 Tax=Chaetomium fimeti TaxID=1854472 RepID=A0AAE0HNH8_9PEZI|nr:cytochrome P450 [Chaetomium fimeti]